MNDNIEIKKTDDIKSSRGTTTLATINNDGNIQIINETMPNKINPYEKQEPIENNKKKKKTKIVTPRERRHSTIISIVMILLLLLSGGSYYYFGVLKNPQNYTIKNVTYELGDEISTNPQDYVNLKNIDELQYILDLKNVNTSKLGSYKYTITYQGKTKTGTINIVDTKGPILIAKENIVLVLNEEYNVDDFIDSCTDPSGCTYDFAERLDTSIAGDHIIKITAKDELNNESTLEIPYKINDNIIISCTLPTTTDTLNSTRVSVTENLYFDNNNVLTKIIKSSINTFFTNDKYQEFKNNHQEENLIFNDYNFSYIKEEEIINSSPYNNKDELINYYSNNGYSCN